jgi:hypothetical protein
MPTMRTTVTLPDDLASLVTLEAKRRKTSFASMIRELIAAGLGRTTKQPREIPWAGMFDDPGMVPGSEIDSALAEKWTHAIDSDRG